MRSEFSCKFGTTHRQSFEQEDNEASLGVLIRSSSCSRLSKVTDVGAPLCARTGAPTAAWGRCTPLNDQMLLQFKEQIQGIVIMALRLNPTAFLTGLEGLADFRKRNAKVSALDS